MFNLLFRFKLNFNFLSFFYNWIVFNLCKTIFFLNIISLWTPSKIFKMCTGYLRLRRTPSPYTVCSQQGVVIRRSRIQTFGLHPVGYKRNIFFIFGIGSNKWLFKMVSKYEVNLIISRSKTIYLRTYRTSNWSKIKRLFLSSLQIWSK